MAQSRLTPVHIFLRQGLFYPLAVSMLLCGVLFCGRLILSNARVFDFLAWNLFLAWIPYLLSLWIVKMRKDQQRGWKLWLAVILWALFLPNAPYIVTDFGHLLRGRTFPLMYDIALIFAFAWTGLLLGLTSLYLMQGLVRQAWGRLAAGGFVAGVTLLTGVGVYVGRFLRWNSWDVLARPGRILGSFADALRDPLNHSHAAGHIAVFATEMLLCYLTFLAFRDAVKKESGHSGLHDEFPAWPR